MMVVMALLLCLTMPAKVNAESRQPCGPDAWYELSEDGTLVISGTGETTKKFGEENENVIENVIEISEEKIKKLMPEYSKKKLAKACEILKMISENPVGTTTQTKKKQRPN